MLLLATMNAFYDAMAYALPVLMLICLVGIPLGLSWDWGTKIKLSWTEPEDTEAARQHKLSRTPGWKLWLLNFVTLGSYAPIWFSQLHGKLPKLRRDDPTPGRALFHVMTFTMGRLELRLNEQRKLREMPGVPFGTPMFTVAICNVLVLFLAAGVALQVMNSKKSQSTTTAQAASNPDAAATNVSTNASSDSEKEKKKWQPTAPQLLMGMGILPIALNWLIFAPLACCVVQGSINQICQHDEEERAAAAAEAAEEEGEDETDEEDEDQEAEEVDDEQDSAEDADDEESGDVAEAEAAEEEDVDLAATLDFNIPSAQEGEEAPAEQTTEEASSEMEETIDLNTGEQEPKPADDAGEETIDLSELDFGDSSTKED